MANPAVGAWLVVQIGRTAIAYYGHLLKFKKKYKSMELRGGFSNFAIAFLYLSINVMLSPVKTLLASLLCLFATLAVAQSVRERRVYYIDCSWSMKEAGLWNPVRDNLKRAINNVSDETTELLVVPFAFDTGHHPRLHAYTALATPEGKSRLCESIDALPMSKATMTYHSDPLRDFISSRVAGDRVTYMFLMTDGQNEERPDGATSLLASWGQRYGGRNVYGFYVMLNAAARNPATERVIAGQQNLWSVATADVCINLIRLQRQAVFNVRSETSFDLTVHGDTRGKRFSAAFASDAPYRVTGATLAGGRLRVTVKPKMDIYRLPVSKVFPLQISADGLGKYDILVTRSVDVRCISKPERSLKITVL